MTMTNDAYQKEIEHGEIVFKLRDKHRQLINDITDIYKTPDNRVEHVQKQIEAVNNEIIYHSRQQRLYRSSRYRQLESNNWGNNTDSQEM